MTVGLKLLSSSAIYQQGEEAKVDLNPSNPYSFLTQGHTRAFLAWDKYWWDATNNHIKHTNGGGINFGIYDTTVTYFSMWQMWEAFGVYFEEWKRADSATQSLCASRMTAQWTHITSVYGAQALKSGDNSSGGTYVVYTCDDAVWHAYGLRMVSEFFGVTSTQGALALGYLVEFIPTITTRFLDPQQTTASLVTNTDVSTPGGVVFKYGQRGMLYPNPNDQASVQQYLYISSSIEAGFGDTALWLSQQSGCPANLVAPFQAYAVSTYTWIHTYLRSGSGDSTRAAVGLYFASLNLDQNVNASNNTAINSGQAATGTYDPNQQYMQPYNGYFGAPVRELSAHWDAAHYNMGILAANLFIFSGNTTYKTEALSVTTAASAPNGFGRTRDGLPFIGNIRDPHSLGMWLAYLMRVVSGLSGFDPNLLFQQSLLNSARKVILSSVNGLMDANWGGPELNPNDGSSTWEDSSGLQGLNGSGQAKREQIMVSSGAMSLCIAAMRNPTSEAVLGSGIDLLAAVPMLPFLMSAIRMTVEESMSRKGGNFTGPISVKDNAFRLDNLNGNPFLNWANQCLDYFDRTNVNRIIELAGAQVFLLGAGGFGLQIAGPLRPNHGVSTWGSGAGAPSFAAPVGSLYTRTDGGAGTTLYVKESGTDNTGWVAK